MYEESKARTNISSCAVLKCKTCTSNDAGNMSRILTVTCHNISSGLWPCNLDYITDPQTKESLDMTTMHCHANHCHDNHCHDNLTVTGMIL